MASGIVFLPSKCIKVKNSSVDKREELPLLNVKQMKLVAEVFHWAASNQIWDKTADMGQYSHLKDTTK